MAAPDNSSARRGVAMAIGAYGLWGVMPTYFHQIAKVPAAQIVSHRIGWSLLLVIGLILATGATRTIRVAMRQPRVIGVLAITAALIAVNWLVYIWAVQHGHVLEASLGYFMNPLVNVALGILFLKERLRPWQAIAVALAAIGVGYTVLAQGAAIWIALVLALSFGIYGLLRKVVAVDALGGMAIETAILAPLAVGYLAWEASRGAMVFVQGDWTTDLLLIGSGPATATPLLLFAIAARRLRYATIGLIQYLAPTMIFAQAVWLFGEPLTHSHVVAFALIWTGLAIYAIDSLRAGRSATPPPLPE